MIDTNGIREDMEVIGADGRHVGTVIRVETHRIKLIKADDGEGAHMGHQHHIACALIAGVESNKVRLSANAAVAIKTKE
jgi:hypothetical protein